MRIKLPPTSTSLSVRRPTHDDLMSNDPRNHEDAIQNPAFEFIWPAQLPIIIPGFPIAHYTFVLALAERARDRSSVANAETFSIPPATMIGIVLDVAALAPVGAKISKLART